MARNIGASGYDSPLNTLFAPERISDKIVAAYHTCALTPALAKSDFFTDQELFCGSSVIYGVETPVSMFGMSTDNNEHPEILSDDGVQSASMTICQEHKFLHKITHRDKRMMCDNFERWESNLRDRIDRGIMQMIDAYSVPKILASASAYNVGNNAGKKTGMVNLGTQDQNALPMKTVDDFENMIFNMRQVATEAGIFCGAGEEMYSGMGGNPVLVIPVSMERHALRLMRDLNTCNGDNNVRRTGLIGKVYGFDVIVTSLLTPMNFGGAVGNLVNAALVDPKQVLHAMDIINNKWWEDKFEDYLVGELIFDTKVMNPDGVIVATVKA